LIPLYQKYYGSVARGHAGDIRAAEVPTDYEVKARKADREFSGAEYARNRPPGPVLTLLKSMPPMTGLVVGHGRSSRTASNSSFLTALRRDRSARGASGAAMGRTRPEV